MKTVPFFAAAPALPSLFERDSHNQLVKVSRDRYVWSYPESAVSVDVQVPTDRVRIIGNSSESDDNFATAIGFGGGKCLFIPEPGTPLSKLNGEGRALIAHKDEFVLDLPSIVVRPSNDWTSAWLDENRWAPSVIAARKEMLDESNGFVLEVRDTHDDVAYLGAFQRSIAASGATITRSSSIRVDHPIDTLIVVSGPRPEDRFSLTTALAQARDRCNQIEAARQAHRVIDNSRTRRMTMSA